MLQLLPKQMMPAYYSDLRRFRAGKFSEDTIISDQQIERYEKAGACFYHAYGDFDKNPIDLKAVVLAFLISEPEYKRLRESQKSELDLEPWQPADGPAVLWVAGVISTVQGGRPRSSAR